jgi:Xaa-Pro aminopeptidase
VFEAMDRELQEAGDSNSLAHHGGHGIGLGHPEAPHFVPKSERTLSAGMVVTLEPGLYGPSFGGIRLENEYLVTADGFERFSSQALGLA